MKQNRPRLFVFPVFSWRAAERFSKEPVKVIDILETGFIGGFSDGDCIIGQQKADFLQAGLYQFVHGSTVEICVIVFIKLAFAQIQYLAQLVDTPGLFTAV